jgi:hypothetical protein
MIEKSNLGENSQFFFVNFIYSTGKVFNQCNLTMFDITDEEVITA